MELNNYEREHLTRLRQANAGCAVLLKKDGSFPLSAAGRIALYGSGARHTVKGGTGSGEVNGRFFITVEQGLQNAGFSITTNEWLDAYDQVLESAKKAFVRSIQREAKATHQQAMVLGMGKIMPEPEYDLPLYGEGDVAVYVLSRVSGEGGDRSIVKGDFLLTDTEVRDILALNRKYKTFMLVLNVGGPVDLFPVLEVRNILLLGQLGTETGVVLADLLLGKSQPSGKLTATWAAWDDYCHVGDECQQDDTRYREGVYVGYRYFDTAGVRPLFPFGYGLGYTDFSLKHGLITVNGSEISITAEVRNTGSQVGREVVQVYLCPPSGRIDRPYQELAAFEKTKALAAGERQTLTLSFDIRDMSCYDTANASYVLEAGDYVLRIGNSSRNTEPAAVLRLDKDAVTLRAENTCGETDFPEWAPARVSGDSKLENLSVCLLDANALAVKSRTEFAGEPLEKLAEEMTAEELIQLNVGAFNPKAGLASIIGTASLSVPGAAGETAHVHGLNPLVMADGPAGLRLSKSYYRDQKGIHVLGSTMPESVAAFLPKIVRWFLNREPKLKPGVEIQHQYCTAIPVGTSVAQSWDRDYAELCGDIVGAEMERFGIQLWLAPALNIHRTVRCGRNYEYYSEDPLISGMMAAFVTKGVQKHPGCGVTIKHYAANNQETNRYNSNSIVSERALREIYLKGFGIAIRESDPAAVMTSYNLINSIHTSQHPGLLKSVLRQQYGFRGVVMTDWVTGGSVLSKNAKHPVPHAGEVAAASGDLFMPGSQKEIKEITEALKDGRLTEQQLRQNASRVIRLMNRLCKGGMSHDL